MEDGRRKSVDVVQQKIVDSSGNGHGDPTIPLLVDLLESIKTLLEDANTLRGRQTLALEKMRPALVALADNTDKFM